jgi:hypothetical protein
MLPDRSGTVPNEKEGDLLIKGIIAVIGIVAVGAVAAMLIFPGALTGLFNSGFDHNKNLVPSGNVLARDIEVGMNVSTNDMTWAVITSGTYKATEDKNASIIPGKSQMVSYSQTAYSKSGSAASSKLVSISLAVFSSTADAKTYGYDPIPKTGFEKYGKFQEAACIWEISTHGAYIFRDMNVVGYIMFVDVELTAAQVDKLMADLEKSIHDRSYKL